MSVLQGSLHDADVNDAMIDDVLNCFDNRPELYAPYLRIDQFITKKFTTKILKQWRSQTKALYQANSGAPVLLKLWAIQQHGYSFIDDDTLVNSTKAVHQLCLYLGSQESLAILQSFEKKLVFDALYYQQWAHWLMMLSQIGKQQRCIGHMFATLIEKYFIINDVQSIAAWLQDGINLHARNKKKLAQWVLLEDKISKQRFEIHEGQQHFFAHEKRIKYLNQALFDYDIMFEISEQSHVMRPMVMGTGVLLPQKLPLIAIKDPKKYYDAVSMHICAHKYYGQAPFSRKGLKPLHIALTILLEDARIERLAQQRYCGLFQLWRGFFVAFNEGAVQAKERLSNLAFLLFDPAQQTQDPWLIKAKTMFETHFNENSTMSDWCVDIARILGHELGQMRVPFDAKNWQITPYYRDDGLHLFDEVEDDSNQQAIEISVTPPENDDHADIDDSNSAKKIEDDDYDFLASYPEWDYRLNSQDHAATTIYLDKHTDNHNDTWLEQLYEQNHLKHEKIKAMLKTKRSSRPQRIKKQAIGDDVDIDALINMRIDRRAHIEPDHRIYTSYKRPSRDIAMALLLDTSQSMQQILPNSQNTILQIAAQAVVLFSDVLAELGDIYSIFSFSSFGADKVLMNQICGFDEKQTHVPKRLQALTAKGSTRLGAPLRHLNMLMQKCKTERKVILVLSDGKPSDIDVADSAYLVEDSRHAVHQLRRSGIDVFCIALGEAAFTDAQAVFGRKYVFHLGNIDELPSRLSMLYYRLTVQ